uniref:Uncharacterized protein n=1 Tax=Anopheles minimus TaxID=112268 RepID=A0A182W565_9DIPT
MVRRLVVNWYPSEHPEIDSNWIFPPVDRDVVISLRVRLCWNSNEQTEPEGRTGRKRSTEFQNLNKNNKTQGSDKLLAANFLLW